MTDKPDYVYDPVEWEITYDWNNRDLLTCGEDLSKPRKYATLVNGPPVWAVKIVLARDDSGDPDETEVQWFFSESEAMAACGES